MYFSDPAAAKQAGPMLVGRSFIACIRPFSFKILSQRGSGDQSVVSCHLFFASVLIRC